MAYDSDDTDLPVAEPKKVPPKATLVGRLPAGRGWQAFPCLQSFLHRSASRLRFGMVQGSVQGA